MSKRRKQPKRPTPIRLENEVKDVVQKIGRFTGWTLTKSLAFLVCTAADALFVGTQAVNNRKKLYELQKELHTAEQKSQDKLKTKRAQVRAAAQALKVTGPDQPDLSAMKAPTT